MLNYILREDEGYPPGDSEILTFMRTDTPKELCDAVSKSPTKPSKLNPDKPDDGFSKIRATITSGSCI